MIFLDFFFSVVLDHAEKTKQRIANGAESLGLLLMLLANLKLHFLNGRCIPV
jgi:hypothetical protein